MSHIYLDILDQKDPRSQESTSKTAQPVVTFTYMIYMDLYGGFLSHGGNPGGHLLHHDILLILGTSWAMAMGLGGCVDHYENGGMGKSS